MNILYLCLTGSFTDNAIYQDNMLAKFHVLQGHKVTILTSLYSLDQNGKYFKYDTEKEYISNDGFKVNRIDNKKGLLSKLNRYFRRYNNTYKHIEVENPDLIFIHGCQFLDIVYVKKFYKYKLKKKESLKILVDNHADKVNSAKNWLSKNIQHRIIWRSCAKLIEPYTDWFYGVTPNRVDFLNEIYNIPREKIKLLNFGVDTTLVDFDKRKELRSEICRVNMIPENDFLIVTGGKIDSLKNIHLLLKALNNIENKSLHLILFGSIAPEMKEVMDKLLKGPNIHYIGWIDTTKAIELFIASDLGVFPGTHSVYWEQAVGCGLPAIFKYWDGMDHVNIGGNCLFLREDSISEIESIIKKLINDDKLYQNMKNAAKDAARYFSYDEIAKKSLQV